MRLFCLHLEIGDVSVSVEFSYVVINCFSLLCVSLIFTTKLCRNPLSFAVRERNH